MDLSCSDSEEGEVKIAKCPQCPDQRRYTTFLAHEKVQQRLGIWNETYIAEWLVDGPLTHILGWIKPPCANPTGLALLPIAPMDTYTPEI